MCLVTLAAVVARTTVAMTGENADRVRRHHHRLVETVALEPVTVQAQTEEPSLLEQPLGKTQRVVKAPVRRLNTRLNHLTCQVEDGSAQAIVIQDVARASVPSRIAHGAVIRIGATKTVAPESCTIALA